MQDSGIAAIQVVETRHSRLNPEARPIMATHSFVEFEIPEASDFTCLRGIRHDLESARCLAEELKDLLGNMWDEKLSSVHILDALMTAVLVRYCRPLSKGLYRKISERILKELTNYQYDKHKHFTNIRNEYIAHPAKSPFEEFQLISRYVEERVHEEGIYGVECQHSRVVGLSVSEVEDLIQLTTVMLRHVDCLLKVEKQKLLARVRSIPLEDLLRKEYYRYASADNVNKPRMK